MAASPSLTIRPATVDDAPAFGRIMADAIGEAFAGRVPAVCLASITPDQNERTWRRILRTARDPERLWTATARDAAGGSVGAGGPPVGFAHASPALDADFDCELRTLVVHPAHHRRGIGRRLVAEAVAHARSQGWTSMLVRVLACNPHLAFYERLGATFVRHEYYDWSGVHLPQLVLGWEDLAALSRIIGRPT